MSISQQTPRAAVEEAIKGYLDVLAGGASGSEFLEIRYRVGAQQLAHDFHHIDERMALAEEIFRRGARTDVYVGCAPRVSRSGTKDAIERVWTLWVECDGADSTHLLHSFRPRPSLVIASGSGPNCHAYWPLAEPVTPVQVETANLRLATALGADLACFDASRILRPPGTWNHKHEPPRPVALLRHERGRCFDAETVLANVPHVDTAAIERRWSPPRRSGRDPLLAIPPAVYVSDLLGAQPGRNRKVHCPFHHDERPSLHAYPTGERGWCCFSCRRGGTIYDLAGGIWGLPTRGADFREIRRRLLALYERELSAGRYRHGRAVER